MLTVPDLIHRLRLISRKSALRVYGVLFEEEPYLVAGCQEVVVPDVIVLSRRELGLKPPGRAG